MKGENCTKCKFYSTFREVGVCRRYPPQIVPEIYGDASDMGSALVMLYPDVDEDDWCGEYKEKEQEK